MWNLTTLNKVTVLRNSYYVREKAWIFALNARKFSRFMSEFPPQVVDTWWREFLLNARTDTSISHKRVEHEARKLTLNIISSSASRVW